uniref:Uncharacterized protein n=1 Tax=Anopheles arabiensis TaxID=7173 RepID=A0A182HQ92_ANOAR
MKVFIVLFAVLALALCDGETDANKKDKRGIVELSNGYDPVYHKQVVEVAKPYPVPVEKSYPVYVKEPHYVHKTVPSTVYDHDSTVYGSSVGYEHKPLWG